MLQIFSRCTYPSSKWAHNLSSCAASTHLPPATVSMSSAHLKSGRPTRLPTPWWGSQEIIFADQRPSTVRANLPAKRHFLLRDSVTQSIIGWVFVSPSIVEADRDKYSTHVSVEGRRKIRKSYRSIFRLWVLSCCSAAFVKAQAGHP